GIDYSVAALGTSFPDDKDYHLIFNGMIQTPVIETMSSLNVSLKRNIARIDFNIKNSTSGAEAVTINSVRILNVPKVSYYFTNYPDGPTEGFPTVSVLSTFGLNQDEYAPMAWEDGNIVSANERSFRFYVPANQRGVGDNSISSYKPFADPDGCSTYIQVDGEYGDSHIPVSYRFYLGANLVDDFNLIPNHTYVYNIEIKDKGDAANDPRVEDWGGVDFTPANIERANCYILNPPQADGYLREFKIPVDRVDTFWYNNDGGYMYEDNSNYALRNNVTWTVYPIWSDFELTEDTFHFVKNQGTGKNDWFTVAVPRGVSGNIVIGLRRNDDPAILWSWHLWVTDYNPDSVHQEATAGKYIYPVTGGDIHRYTDTGKFFMDRNVGALSINYVGSGRGSLYYQFGRKDPFWDSNAVYFYKLNADGSTYSLDSQSATLPKAAGGANKVPASVNNPTTFYTGTAWTSSDQYNPATYNSSILWQDPTTKTGGVREGQKSIFDPCPAGWHVPSNGSWSAFTYNNNAKPTTNINPPSTGVNRGFPAFSGIGGNEGLYFYPYIQNTDGSYTAPDKLIYYSASGSRDNSSGGLSYVGSYGRYWSQSPVNSPNGYYLGFYSTGLNASNGSNRAYGFSVRCVAE
ncbi:MAG: DUF4906 domain-containing protein, partial [Bacteroidia bacterium]|nr:DUF4906 domain-containing protein [Bacteroidia bacterium]